MAFIESLYYAEVFGGFSEEEMADLFEVMDTTVDGIHY